MIKLAPYPEYKDAGVSWVGSIPTHWPEKRAKYYFKEIDDRSQAGDEEMLSVSHITGVTPRSQKNVTMFKAESNVGQKRCQPGDLIINTMWAWMSALGVSNHAGIVSPAYGVYRPRSTQDYDYYYLDNLLRIEGYRSEYICRSTGIRSSRLRLYPDKFLSMPVVCPPQEEQQTIARFLKAQDRLFRKFIRNKRRLIELLKEQKQNIINQAVIRGLDPNVKLKPSGVEWIGDIPEHWEIMALKRLCVRSALYGANIPASEYVDAGIRFLRTTDIREDGTLNPGGVFLRETAVAGYLLNDGDILISRSGTVGRSFLYQSDLHGPCSYAGYLVRYVLSPKANRDYVIAFTKTRVFEGFLRVAAVASTIENVNGEKFANMPILVPPSDEQSDITDHIKEESLPIDQAISRAEREIELMREYRTRLISDVVTGQVDVRGIVVQEVAEDELLALDEDTGEADDVIDDEGDMDETD